MQFRQLLITTLLAAAATAHANDYDQFYTQLPTNVAPVTPVVIPHDTVNIADFGAVGNGHTLCTEAFEKAISKAAKKGGYILVPRGVWLTGPIALKDNVGLHIAAGAIVVFSPDKRLYVDASAKPGSRALPCIRASKRKNIAITGSGVIDGGGQLWRPVKRSKMSDVEWAAYQRMGGQTDDNGSLWYPWQLKNGYPDIAETPRQQEAMRNDLIRLTDCENVLVEGVTIQNSPRFHLHPCYCTNVIIDGVTVRSEWNVQNADGIDLSDCHRALIVRSTVSVGDDGICLKSGKPSAGRIAGCEDIVVADNTVNHAHGGFVLGSETAGGMRRIVARRCTFSGTDTGLRFKSSPGRGGTTEQLFVSDITMNDIAAEAIVFQCDYVNNHAGSKGTAPAFTAEQRQWAPHFQDIHISRVVCRGAQTGIKAKGISGMECVSGITIADATIIYHENDKDIDEQTTQLTLSNVELLKE